MLFNGENIVQVLFNKMIELALWERISLSVDKRICAKIITIFSHIEDNIKRIDDFAFIDGISIYTKEERQLLGIEEESINSILKEINLDLRKIKISAPSKIHSNYLSIFNEKSKKIENQMLKLDEITNNSKKLNHQ